MTTHRSARLALALALTLTSARSLAQPPLPPPMPPSQPPATLDTPPKRRHDDGRTDREIGLTALVAGYLMGSLIVLGPPLFTKNGRAPVQNAAEKRLGLIPVAGPMMWWFRARFRLDASGCSGCFVDLDSGFHNILALPYAIVATGAQAIGVGMLTYGILESNNAVASSTAPPVAKLYVAPTPGGLSLQGTF
jgi:hypothetical protein